jgi:hypothetical protein
MRFDCIKAVQTFKCLANKRYVFDLLGAKGTGSSGGTGGHVQAIFSHTADITLNLYVGGRTDDNSDDKNAWKTGGWNGGGAGGACATSGTDADGWTAAGLWPGCGGGGATDIRMSGTNYSHRILVAGGGGGGAGGRGGKFPEVVQSAGTYCTEHHGVEYNGGLRGTLHAGGAGGAAPTIIGWNHDASGSFFYYPGDGGGGGYYGGGGGSSGTVVGTHGVSYSGVAGGNGGLGVGGAGGSKTSMSTGIYGGTSGGGGGGSSYIGTNAQLSYGVYDQCANNGSGYILVSEVISAPVITGVRKDGNAVYITVTKEEREDNIDIEERFYFTWSLDPADGQYTRKRNPLNSVIVLKDEEVEIKFTIPSNTAAGYHKLYFSITSADERRDETYIDFVWNDVSPTVEFNAEVLNNVLLQGTELENVFTGTGMFVGATDLIYEKKIIINGNEYGKVQSGSDRSIFLPYIYNGVYDDMYTFKVKVRVGQMANGLHGIGREIWSDWFESDEYIVYAPVIPINKAYFKTKLNNTAIERHTKITIEWGSNDKFLEPGEYDYVLSMYNNDELLYEQNYGQETKAQIVMSYSQGDNYKFGIALLKNGMFPSDVNFSESFCISETTTSNKIDLSDDLILSTDIIDEFDRLEVFINEDLEYTSKGNISISIPNWKLQTGHNTINIFVYVTESIFIKHSYNVYMHVVQSDVVNVDTHNFEVYISIDNEENYSKMIEEDTTAVKLGMSEKEFEARLSADTIQEVNQRITIKNNGKNHDLKIIDIFGSID